MPKKGHNLALHSAVFQIWSQIHVVFVNAFYFIRLNRSYIWNLFRGIYTCPVSIHLKYVKWWDALLPIKGVHQGHSPECRSLGFTISMTLTSLKGTSEAADK